MWPDAEAGAAERAAHAAPPPVPAEVVDKVEESGWYVRDVAYPYEILARIVRFFFFFLKLRGKSRKRKKEKLTSIFTLAASNPKKKQLENLTDPR